MAFTPAALSSSLKSDDKAIFSQANLPARSLKFLDLWSLPLGFNTGSVVLSLLSLLLAFSKNLTLVMDAAAT
jgi:hypothetical protein